MVWEPATKTEVLAALDADWIDTDPSLKHRLSVYLIEPELAEIERFGQTEGAFVVARFGRWVVYFDDVEEIFGTAELHRGRLLNPASYGHVAVALRELERLAR
jgi:hypothetical protein